MITNPNKIAIVADDLTGANDSALQFYMQGADTKIILNNTDGIKNSESTEVWAIATETRNVSAQVAFETVKDVAQTLINELNPDYFFKKIDSTIRGNIAIETLTLLNELKWDAAVVVPAYPDEQRITVGGYHLLRSMPIERTEISHDPLAPICESHLPTLFASQIEEDYHSLIGHIELKTVMKGAGPILMTLNELIDNGKKLIIMDTVSNTDIEQISLAINKSDKRILPTGTAAFAKALAKMWLYNDEDFQTSPECKRIPQLPKCIISGSATPLSKSQVRALKASPQFVNFCEYDLKFNDIIMGVSEELVASIAQNINSGKNILIHASNLLENGFSPEKIACENDENTNFPTLITDYLAKLACQIKEYSQSIFILIGGETSYKSCELMGATTLQLIDHVTGAIPLCLDANGQWIVTKSGNLGDTNTLIEVVKYFEK